jgi:hypothetical protein
MFNANRLADPERPLHGRPKPAKCLANARVVLFYQTRGGVFYPGREWWKLSTQFKK